MFDGLQLRVQRASTAVAVAGALCVRVVRSLFVVGRFGRVAKSLYCGHFSQGAQRDSCCALQFATLRTAITH